MIRSLILVSLAAALILSLVDSFAIRRGHADVPVAATADQVQPLQSGELAPRFIVRTVESAPFDFDPAKLKRPVLVLTFRGGWCPYCNTYMSDMRHVIPEIRDMGIDVLFLSGDRSELLFESLKGETQEDIAGLDYTILSDADAQAAIAFGIAFRASDSTIQRREEKGQDIEASSMRRHGVLPVPAVFAIDKDGVIAYSYVNADYKIRLPAEELMSAARMIAAAD
jgi:peroxiredoxin